MRKHLPRAPFRRLLKARYRCVPGESHSAGLLPAAIDELQLRVEDLVHLIVSNAAKTVRNEDRRIIRPDDVITALQQIGHEGTTIKGQQTPHPHATEQASE